MLLLLLLVVQVVKWMDAALQKRRREEHLAAMRQGLVPSMSMSEHPLYMLYMFMLYIGFSFWMGTVCVRVTLGSNHHW